MGDEHDVKLLGLGLDNQDGHVRVTKGEQFHLVGGSQETHAKMQDTAMTVQHELDKRGLKLSECAPREFDDIAKRAGLTRRS